MTVPKVRIRGISACVPKEIHENIDYKGFQHEEAADIIKSIGIERRRIADQNTCASDLCYFAAEKLIEDLMWEKSEIECLIVVTLTPDYILPATSSILQKRLGLNGEVFTLDISLGCTGWIYGLQVISSLISVGDIKKGLLLVGDTSSKICSREDKTTFPLFGDAGSATAIEFDETGPSFSFHSSSDGAGYQSLIIPSGGYRNQVTINSLEMIEIRPGVKRNQLNMILDGMNIFSFSISKAPESVMLLSKKFGINIDQIDYFVFHQANYFMNERIRRKLTLPEEKVPYSLKDYGNTGPAAIPLTIVTQISKFLRYQRKSIIASGFGAGLTWGSVYFITENLVCPDLIEI